MKEMTRKEGGKKKWPGFEGEGECTKEKRGSDNIERSKREEGREVKVEWAPERLEGVEVRET